MKTLKQYKTEQMKNSAFAREYEAIQSEMDKIGGGGGYAENCGKQN